MPVFAVAAAVVAIGIAVEVGTTLAIIAAVGATIGAVGAVTGSKELMIAGGVIGAIGGIGALASSAGIFGSAASAVGSAATSVGESAAGVAGGIDAEIAQWASYGAGASEALAGAPSIGAVAPAIDNTLDVVDTVSGTVNTASDPLGSVATNASGPNVSPVAASDAGIPNTQMAGQEMVDANGQVIQGDAGIVNSPTAPKAPTAPGTVPDTPIGKTADILAGGQGVTGAPAPGTTVTGAPLPSAESLINAGNVNNLPGSAIARVPTGSGIFGQIMDTIGKPGVGTLASGVVQAGMSFLSGATNGLTPAQIAALNAQAEANQAAANLARTQQANMSGGLPVATRTPAVRSPPVTGAPAGLINTPPPQGAPA